MNYEAIATELKEKEGQSFKVVESDGLLDEEKGKMRATEDIQKIIKSS